MRRIVFVLVLVMAASAQAQLVPVGGMSAGCPTSWGHRTGAARTFSCANTQSGSFCNGGYRASAGASLAEEGAAARAQIVAQGFVIRSERDTQGMHVIEYDDAAGHRIALFVRWAPIESVIVTCGSDPTTFAADVATFTSVADTAR